MSDSDIVQDFLVESSENLDRLDRDLIGLEKNPKDLEKNPKDKDALAGVFRTIHTIKGTCGFLGFNKLEKVVHVGENLLTRLRDGQLALTPDITTALLSMVDAVRQMLSQIEMRGGIDTFTVSDFGGVSGQTLRIIGHNVEHVRSGSRWDFRLSPPGGE
jgi:two-component system, chemotaxis family, sensor kinase CheA